MSRTRRRLLLAGAAALALLTGGVAWVASGDRSDPPAPANRPKVGPDGKPLAGVAVHFAVGSPEAKALEAGKSVRMAVPGGYVEMKPLEKPVRFPGPEQ